jgi:hypothetical protein
MRKMRIRELVLGYELVYVFLLEDRHVVEEE